MSQSLFAVIRLLSLYICISYDGLSFAIITLTRIVLYEFISVVVVSIRLITLILIIVARVSFFYRRRVKLITVGTFLFINGVMLLYSTYLLLFGIKKGNH